MSTLNSETVTSDLIKCGTICSGAVFCCVLLSCHMGNVVGGACEKVKLGAIYSLCSPELGRLTAGLLAAAAAPAAASVFVPPPSSPLLLSTHTQAGSNRDQPASHINAFNQ